MPFPKVEFKIEPDGQTALWLDGVEISGVEGVTISSIPGEAPRITVEILAGALTAEAEGILTPHIIRATRERVRTHSS